MSLIKSKPYMVAPDGRLYIATTAKLARNRQIVEKRAAGVPYSAIAEEFGISVPRVRQILQFMERVEKLVPHDS